MADHIDKEELYIIKEDLAAAFSELLNYIDKIPTGDPSGVAPVNIARLHRLAGNVATQANHIVKLKKR